MNSIFGRTVASGAHLGLYGHGTYHILVGESIRTIPHGAECSVIHVKDVTFEYSVEKCVVNSTEKASPLSTKGF